MSRKTASSAFTLLLISWTLLILPASAQHFQQVTGTLTQVAAGRNEVFGFDVHGQVWRYKPPRNPSAK